MSRIVVAENAVGPGLAPAHSRSGQQAMEKTRIQVFENCVQIVEMSSGRVQELAAAHLPYQVRLAHDLVAGDIPSITSRMAAVNRFAVHLREQDVGDGAKNCLRRA